MGQGVDTKRSSGNGEGIRTDWNLGHLLQAEESHGAQQGADAGETEEGEREAVARGDGAAGGSGESAVRAAWIGDCKSMKNFGIFISMRLCP